MHRKVKLHLPAQDAARQRAQPCQGVHPVERNLPERVGQRGGGGGSRPTAQQSPEVSIDDLDKE